MVQTPVTEATAGQSTPPSTTLEYARYCIARHIGVIPLKPKSKIPAIPAWKEYQGRLATDAELVQWFSGTDNNIAIVTGSISNLTVVDLDTADAVEFARANFPATPSVKTGKGYHLYYRFKDGSRNFQKRADLPGIDLRSEGGYVVAPPSIHPSGHQYIWTKDRGMDFPMSELPDMVIAQSEAEKTPVQQLFKGSAEGSRNMNLARLAGSWAAAGLTIDEALYNAEIVNAKNDPPLSGVEVQRTVRSIYNKHLSKQQTVKIAPPQEQTVIQISDPKFGQVETTSQATQVEQVPTSPKFSLTDVGNAERLVHIAKDNIMHIYKLKQFFLWTGKKWTEDDGDGMMSHALKTASNILDEAAEASRAKDANRAQALAEHGRRSHGLQRLNAMIELTKPLVAVKVAELDAHDVMSLDNCILHINQDNSITTTNYDGDFASDAIKYLKCTKSLNVSFDADAECPEFLRFLKRILPNRETRRFLQKALGYSLTALTAEQCLFILYGLGANGKTTFMNAVQHIFGDYTLSMPADALMIKQGNGNNANNDIARLRGVRLVVASESDEGKRLAESLVKQLTGGDRISARHLYSDFFDFYPVFKLFLLTNHKPVIRGDDYAIWRRIRLIPFDVKIPPAEQDRSLPAKLKAEKSGILNWMLQGLAMYRTEGLIPPDEVSGATEAYKAEQDTFGAFLDEYCDIKPGLTAPQKNLYWKYEVWAEDNGISYPLSKPGVAKKLRERGFTDMRTNAGYLWMGIGLKP